MKIMAITIKQNKFNEGTVWPPDKMQILYLHQLQDNQGAPVIYGEQGKEIKHKNKDKNCKTTAKMLLTIKACVS